MLKLVKLFYHINISKILKFRWLITIGILNIGVNVLAQRDNVWLLHNIPQLSQNQDTGFCYNFNFCPPLVQKIYLQKDNYYDYKFLQRTSQYFPRFDGSFCDTLGQFVFTELFGMHYYNQSGKIYNQTSINPSIYNYNNNGSLGIFMSVKDRTYYFKAFQKYTYDTIAPNNVKRNFDSIILYVSEFTNSGTLISKNKKIYSIKNSCSTIDWNMLQLFRGKKVDEQTAELFIGYTASKKGHERLHYDFNSGAITKQIPVFNDTYFEDMNTFIKYSSNKNKFAHTDTNQKDLRVYINTNKTDYALEKIIDFSKFPSPAKGYVYSGKGDICFSPNDSVLYAIVGYNKDTQSVNPILNAYLIVLKYYNPYVDYKFITLYEKEKSVKGNSPNYYLKLGPDGNIYGSSGGKVNGNFRIVRPNRVSTYKFEQMPDIKDGSLQPNYSLYISTLEDYKKTEFTWQPTCDSLKVRFTNTCDTQYFKRYRLFFDNGDSIDLGKNWNTKIYNYAKTGKYYVRLKAFSKIGGFIWYGDSIEVNMPPIAKFGIQKTKGCQWIGYGFTDSSKLFGIKPGFTAYKHWLFGDGKDSIDASSNPKLTYTYTTSNTFTVKLVVNNGYCTDTASQINNVVILPAPKPGISAAPLTGCTPLKVNFSYKYSDVLDSAVWRSGFAASPGYKGIVGNFVYNTVGNFWLSQKLYGPSGCITADSVLIKVNPGISGMPDILAATVVNENSIDLKWTKHLNAVSYSIIKNNSFLTRTPDTSYTDRAANTLMPNSYTIKAISQCNDSSSLQDVAQTIYLQALRTDNNEAKLNWNSYQRWEFGVNTYQLFSQNDAGYFELMATINGQTLDYLDKEFGTVSEAQRCYKIIADEKDGNLQQSASNIYCLPLKPILLIPNAFSPNGDGVNDRWKIDYKGIKEAHIKIFNRWGEVIFKSTAEKPEWDAIYKGLPVPVGTYFYQIEATGITVGKVYKSGLVEVVR